MDSQQPSFFIFSGGSACNSIVKAFQSLSTDTCYILGVSDNGGSTSELLRVLGGPSIGDLRSRLTRLINTDAKERLAIKDLLSYRLPAGGDERAIKEEWADIVEGRHRLWRSIPEEKKETIRGFLTYFDFEILKRAHKRFNFRNGSIGNFFLTGARLFFGSLEAAIFLFSAITGITDLTTVIPVINTNHTATIAAVLENGQTLVGQCEISHPSANPPKNNIRVNPIDAFSYFASPASPVNMFNENSKHLQVILNDEEEQEPFESDINSNLVFSKFSTSQLSARISRIFYINEYGQEIYPYPNPKILKQLNTKKVLIYSIGSLYTSIMPCLILRSVAKSIVNSSSLTHKILILNAYPDRETPKYTAVEFVQAITDGLNSSLFIDVRRQYYHQMESYVKEHDDVDGHAPKLSTPSIISLVPYKLATATKPMVIPMASSRTSQLRSSSPGFFSQDSSPLALHPHEPPEVCDYRPTIHGPLDQHAPPPSLPGTPPTFPTFPQHMFSPKPPNAYITHLIYLSNGGMDVDVSKINEFGIQCCPIEGKLQKDEAGEMKAMFDDQSLAIVLKQILG